MVKTNQINKTIIVIGIQHKEMMMKEKNPYKL